ncbi:MAG: class I SAM-dependent methyltransferase [Acidimicrobiales bacterium]
MRLGPERAQQWERTLRAAGAIARHPAKAAGAAARAAASAALDAEENVPVDPRFEQFWSDLWIPGWLDKAQASILYHLAVGGPGTGEVVEIGSYLGRSAAVLAAALRARGSGVLTAIDPHDGNRGLPGTEDPNLSTYPLFQHHLRQYQLEDYVDGVVASSVEAARDWSRPVRLLYLDGLHTEDAVHADLAAWGPHMEDTGVMVIDDYDYFEGIARAVWSALDEGLVAGGPHRVCNSVLLGRLPESLSRISRLVLPLPAKV